MQDTKSGEVRKALTVVGMVAVFATGFFIFGLFIDIQIILKYNYTPIPFTFVLPFLGALIGFLLAFRTIKPHE